SSASASQPRRSVSGFVGDAKPSKACIAARSSSIADHHAPTLFSPARPSQNSGRAGPPRPTTTKPRNVSSTRSAEAATRTENQRRLHDIGHAQFTRLLPVVLVRAERKRDRAREICK